MMDIEEDESVTYVTTPYGEKIYDNGLELDVLTGMQRLYNYDEMEWVDVLEYNNYLEELKADAAALAQSEKEHELEVAGQSIWDETMHWLEDLKNGKIDFSLYNGSDVKNDYTKFTDAQIIEYRNAFKVDRWSYANDEQYEYELQKAMISSLPIPATGALGWADYIGKLSTSMFSITGELATGLSTIGEDVFKQQFLPALGSPEVYNFILRNVMNAYRNELQTLGLSPAFLGLFEPKATVTKEVEIASTGYWQFSKNVKSPGYGWMKSKYGDYYIRKR